MGQTNKRAREFSAELARPKNHPKPTTANPSPDARDLASPESHDFSRRRPDSDNDRPKNHATVSVRFTEDQLERIREAALRDRRSISAYVLHAALSRVAIQETLRSLPPSGRTAKEADSNPPSTRTPAA